MVRVALPSRGAYEALLKKWAPLCAPIAKSVEEADPELLTFCDFPKGMWKCLRATNALENLSLNRESWPQTKTQSSFSRSQGGLLGPIRCNEKKFRFLGAAPELLGWPQHNPELARSVAS